MTANVFSDGLRLLEASAGTGKTYAITRYVLSLVLRTSPLDLSTVVVVTFTRAATDELQGRIREFLYTACETLARLRDDSDEARDPRDLELEAEYRALAAEPWIGVDEAWRRVSRAVRDFDRLVVSTIHGLCHRILTQNALLTGSAVRATLRENIAQDLTEALNDTLVDCERARSERWAVWSLSEVVSQAASGDWLPPSWLTAADVAFPAALTSLTVDEHIARLDQLALAAAAAIERDANVFVDQLIDVRLSSWAKTKSKAAGDGFFHADFCCRGEAGRDLLRISFAAMAAYLRSDRVRNLAYWSTHSPPKPGARTKTEAVALFDLVSHLPQFANSEFLRGVVPSWFTGAYLRKAAKDDPTRIALTEAPLVVAVQAVVDAHFTASAALRAAIVVATRTRVEQRLRASDAISHNETIAAVERALLGPQSEALIKALRQRFRYAFVDEFQDTDPAQWTLFERVFTDGGTPIHDGALYAIGDPKQAIYSFRGADVKTYLQAAEMVRNSGSDHVRQLNENFRSAGEHVEAVNVLFHHQLRTDVSSTGEALVRSPFPLPLPPMEPGLQFDYPTLQTPADGGATDGIVHASVSAALQARVDLAGPNSVVPGIEVVVLRRHATVDLPRQGDEPRVHAPDEALYEKLASSSQESGLARRVAMDIAEIIGQRRVLPPLQMKDGASNTASPRQVAPGDIAVLGYQKAALRSVYRELLELGVPATLWTDSSIADSAACGWMLAILSVLETPDRSDARTLLADTPLFDVGVNNLALLRDPVSDASARFSEWALNLVDAVSRYGVLRALRDVLDDADWNQRVLGQTSADRRSPAVRVLSRPAGERELADLLQLIEVVDRWNRRDRVTWDSARQRLASARTKQVAGFAARSKKGATKSGVANEIDNELVARLESDTPGVRLVTLHKAKGLEFPLVFLLPMRASAFPATLIEDRRSGRLHRVPDVWKLDERSRTRRTEGIDRGADEKWLKDAREDAARNDINEMTRLAYVGLTRARILTRWYVSVPGRNASKPVNAASRLLGWWLAPSTAALDALSTSASSELDTSGWPATLWEKKSPRTSAPKTHDELLSRIVFSLRARAESLNHDAKLSRPRVPILRLEWMQARAFEQAEPLRAAALEAISEAGHAPDRADELLARPWDRPGFARSWKTWSFSSIKAFAKPPAGVPGYVTSEVANDAFARVPIGAGLTVSEHGGGEEPELTAETNEAIAEIDAGPLADALPLGAFPAGTRPGTCLHAIFENYDFTRVDAEPEGPKKSSDNNSLHAVMSAAFRQHAISEDRWLESAHLGLSTALRTPLGGPLNGWRLADLSRHERLNELRFSLALRGGLKNRGETIAPSELAEALVARPFNDAFSEEYADSVRAANFGALGLAGFLTGSIDLVFRACADGAQRWYVADYKSNRVSTDYTREPKASDFAFSALRREMEHHHYLLQMTLYLVALHRFLGSRLRNYSYDEHVGGAYYLFVRGMNAPAPRSTETDRSDVPLGPGVFFDRPPAAYIERLSRIFDNGLSGTAAHEEASR